MKIVDHRLVLDDDQPVNFKETPNMGGKVIPEYVIIHYTAGQNAQGAIDWLSNPVSKISAHLVISREGEITQLVPFDRIAFHAGWSTWASREGLNRYAIGIELDNAGKLKRKANGNWVAWFGEEYDPDLVIEATHKNDSQPFGWHEYTGTQIEVAEKVTRVLLNHYGMFDVLGHDDIAPTRKWDPGPAFPMQTFKERIVGNQEEFIPLFEVNSQTSLRVEPNPQARQVGRKLQPGFDKLQIIEEKQIWSMVEVVDGTEAVISIQGWLLTRVLRRIQ